MNGSNVAWLLQVRMSTTTAAQSIESKLCGVPNVAYQVPNGPKQRVRVTASAMLLGPGGPAWTVAWGAERWPEGEAAWNEAGAGLGALGMYVGVEDVGLGVTLWAGTCGPCGPQGDVFG